jgi:tyrosine-protein kinase Etk/Wzc
MSSSYARIDEVAPPAAPPGSTVLDLAAVLLRHVRLLLLCTLLVAALAALYAFSQPRRWTSRVVLVPSSTSSGDSRLQLMASQLGLAGLANRGGGPGQSVAAIVKSRALRDSVSRAVRGARQTALSKRALDRLLRRGTSVSTDQLTRAVSIDISAPDPRLAQRLASAFPAAVNAIATQIALEAAAHKRETLERQIVLARANLLSSQQQLLAFQERTRTPQIQEQARQSVAAAAELQRGVTQQELRVAQLQRVSTPDNPEYRSALAQLATLRAQLRRLTSEGSEVFLSGRALPSVQLQMAQLMREYTKNDQIYSMLTADLVEAQLDLRNDMEVVSVLDAADLPERPSGPPRALILALGLFCGAALGAFLAFVAEYLEQARRPGEPFFVELDRLRGGQRQQRRAGVG